MAGVYNFLKLKMWFNCTLLVTKIFLVTLFSYYEYREYYEYLSGFFISFQFYFTKFYLFLSICLFYLKFLSQWTVTNRVCRYRHAIICHCVTFDLSLVERKTKIKTKTEKKKEKIISILQIYFISISLPVYLFIYIHTY